MDWWLKCKTWNHKNPRRKHSQDTFWHQSVQYFLSVFSGKDNKGKNKQRDHIKLKSFYMEVETINKNENVTDWMGEDIWKWYKGFTSKYMKNSYNSILKNQTIHCKNGPRTWIDIFPKKAYKWPTDTWRMLISHPGKSNHMEIKTIMKYYLTSVRIVVIKKTRNN